MILAYGCHVNHSIAVVGVGIFSNNGDLIFSSTKRLQFKICEL